MTSILALWMPILLSAVVIFILSSVIHMVLPWHKSDYPSLPDEDRFAAAINPLNIPPGDYFVPRPRAREDLRSEEFKERMKRGPVMMMTVMPTGQMSMTGNLVNWFIYLVIIGIFAAFVATRTLGPGADRYVVGSVVAATSFLAFGAALWQLSIWYRRSWYTTFKATVDGAIYAVVAGALFGWLWPR